MVPDLRIGVARVGAVDVPLPAYQTDGAAGMDLHAALEAPLVLEPGARARIPTGLALAIPANFEGQVRPRSGLAAKAGVTVLNAPGTIDSDYRGEVQVLLVNLGTRPATIAPLDRIAQLVVAPVARAELVVLDELPPTSRGEGGYGSTGGHPGAEPSSSDVSRVGLPEAARLPPHSTPQLPSHLPSGEVGPATSRRVRRGRSEP